MSQCFWAKKLQIKLFKQIKLYTLKAVGFSAPMLYVCPFNSFKEWSIQNGEGSHIGEQFTMEKLGTWCQTANTNSEVRLLYSDGVLFTLMTRETGSTLFLDSSSPKPHTSIQSSGKCQINPKRGTFSKFPDHYSSKMSSITKKVWETIPYDYKDMKTKQPDGILGQKKKRRKSEKKKSKQSMCSSQ